MNWKKTSLVLAGATAALAMSTALSFAGEIVWWTPNWGQERAQQLATAFESANPGITVKLEITTSDGLPQRVLTALQSGAPPDLIEVQHGWVNGYAQNNLVLPMDDVIKDREDFFPAGLEYVSSGGKLWAVPYRLEVLAGFYNKQHFRDAGLDPEAPPQTWDELEAAAVALTAAGHSGFAITGGGEVGNTISRSLPFMWTNGGGIISQDGTEVLINTPESVEAVKFWTDFALNGQSPASTLQNDGTANRRLFIAGEVSMYQAGLPDKKAILAENPDIDLGVFFNPHPDGVDPVGYLGGWSFVVPSEAKNPDETKLFVQFLAESGNMAFLTDTFPARITSMEDPKFSADPIIQTFRDAVKFGRPVPAHKNWVQITQAYFDGVQRILLGEEDAQTSMDGVAAEIEELL